MEGYIIIPDNEIKYMDNIQNYKFKPFGKISNILSNEEIPILYNFDDAVNIINKMKYKNDLNKNSVINGYVILKIKINNNEDTKDIDIYNTNSYIKYTGKVNYDNLKTNANIKNYMIIHFCIHMMMKIMKNQIHMSRRFQVLDIKNMCIC